MIFRRLTALWSNRKPTNHSHSDLIADSVFASLFNYEPPETTEAGQIWPPSVSCQGWNNRTLPRAIHYSKNEIREILNPIYDQGIEHGEILLSDFKNGLPNILWAEVFERVISICQALDHEPIVEPKQTILFGTLGDTRFLYRVMDHISNLRAILLDELYYANIISPYFLFRKLIKPPGVIIFMNTANKVPEHAGVHRFLRDLSCGSIDNTKHDIIQIHDDPHGYGVSYEMVN